ncbi:MAG: type transport system permease protein [Chloroflexota bacterium]|jgi:ABC-2 type transport system permease protein|nr:type transport system permease protein [Chloroflexota bacterium]
MRAGPVIAVALRLLQQFRRDRRTLGLVFGAPIVILTLLGALMRGSTTATPHVATVNEDTATLGQTVAGYLEQQGGFSKQSSRASAESAMRAGKLDGYVVFPRTFTASATISHKFNEELRIEGGSQATRGYLQQQLAAAELRAFIGAQPKPPQVPVDAPKVTYLHGGAGLDGLDYLGAAFIGVVVFFLVFIVTSVVFLRERTQGTLERLMASPIRRGELVLGYMLALGLLTFLQSVVVLAFSLAVIHVHNEGSVLLVLVFTGLMGLGAANLGIFVSVFSRSEFQAVQFVPIVVAPQLFLAGLIFPVDSEPLVLRIISNVLPLTYGIRGLRDVMIRGSGLGSGEVIRDLLVLLLFAGLAVAAAAASLRRRVA